MNTINIRNLSDNLFKARERLEQVKSEAAILTLSGHQRAVSISVVSERGTRKLDVTELDDRYYQVKQTRGMEMVLLGLKKWYAAEIDRAKDQVAAIEQKLRQETK